MTHGAERPAAGGDHAGWWRRLMDSIDAKDTAGFVAFLTDDCEFRFGNAEPVRGKAAIAAAVDGFFGTIRASRHSIAHTWTDATTRVCEGTVRYTRLDGSEVTVPFVNVFYMGGERIERYLIYIDNAPLYAA